MPLTDAATRNETLCLTAPMVPLLSRAACDGSSPLAGALQALIKAKTWSAEAEELMTFLFTAEMAASDEDEEEFFRAQRRSRRSPRGQ